LLKNIWKFSRGDLGSDKETLTVKKFIFYDGKSEKSWEEDIEFVLYFFLTYKERSNAEKDGRKLEKV